MSHLECLKSIKSSLDLLSSISLLPEISVVLLHEIHIPGPMRKFIQGKSQEMCMFQLFVLNLQLALRSEIFNNQCWHPNCSLYRNRSVELRSICIMITKCYRKQKRKKIRHFMNDEFKEQLWNLILLRSFIGIPPLPVSWHGVIHI